MRKIFPYITIKLTEIKIFNLSSIHKNLLINITFIVAVSLLLASKVISQESTVSNTGSIIKLKLKDKFSLTDSVFNNTVTKNNSGSQFKKQDRKVNYLKFGVITGVTAGAFWWLHNYQKNAWWRGQRGEFHFQDNWD